MEPLSAAGRGDGRDAGSDLGCGRTATHRPENSRPRGALTGYERGRFPRGAWGPKHYARRELAATGLERLALDAAGALSAGRSADARKRTAVGRQQAA